MRILFLTPEVPHPPDSGGRLKTATVLDYLRREHDVIVICFRRRELSAEQRRWVEEASDVHTVPLNRGRNVLTLARSYLAGIPLSIARNRSPEMAALAAQRSGKEGFNAVFVDHWLMAQYLPVDSPGRKLLHEHNAEYVIWQREAAAARNPLLRLLLHREAARVRAYEAGVLGRFDTVFAVSEQDRQALVDLGASAGKVRVLPNLPDPALLTSPPLSFEQSPPVILLLGTLSWKPNIDSANRLLRDIFPQVRARLPESRFVLAGRDAPRSLRTLADRTPGAEFNGDAVDVEALYRRARVFVEATRTGGGTKLKVLNALARGLPVVVSPEGAEGLEVTAGDNLLVAASDTTFAEAAVRLLTDEALWRRLSEGGRTLVRERYVADVAFVQLDEALRGVPAGG